MSALAESSPGAGAQPADLEPGSDAGPPSDFRLLLPPGWVRIPLTEDSTARIVALATERARLAPVSMQESLRTTLVSTLARATSEARQAGGIDLLLSVDAVEGVPTPASCLVSYVSPDGMMPDSASLMEQLAGPDVTVSTVDLPLGTGVRRQYLRWTEESGVAVTITGLDFWVPMPVRGGYLVFAFSTPSLELAPALLDLFDAMAASLRWVRR